MKRFLAIIAFLFSLTTLAWSQARIPGETWMRYADPGEAGWSNEKLAEAKTYWDALDSAAWMVVENGVVVVAWGDVERRYMCHSVRKSFMSGLYGLYIDAGVIDTQKTMAELGIDDEPKLTDQEKTARIEDLLCARSGVYKLAAYEPPQNPKPPRGSHAPGTNWCYNNWDFNTLCAILEQETGDKVFEVFGERFAKPIGMQDYRVRDGYYHYELDKSIHPAYPFRLSARDSARYGLLYLYEGKWGDQQILSSEYVKRSTKSYSDTGSGGYGYMWWTYDDARLEGTGLYAAQGVGGQTIAVLPGRDLVIINRTNTYLGKNVNSERRLTLIDLILKAKTGETPADVELVALEASAPLKATSASRAELAEYVGTYDLENTTDGVIPITVRLEGETLVIETQFTGAYGLAPMQPDYFLTEDMLAYVYFEKKANGGSGDLHWEMTYMRAFDAQLNAGDIEGAMSTAEQSVELFPKSSLSHAMLGIAFDATGDPGLAAELCEAALELDPRNVEAKGLLEALADR